MSSKLAPRIGTVTWGTARTGAYWTKLAGQLSATRTWHGPSPIKSSPIGMIV